MAELQGDPREAAHHPRTLPGLVGHEAAQTQLARAFASGKLHHAWLISGPRGVGKATLAYAMAAHVLSGASGLDKLDALPDTQTGRWLASQSHPDLFVLERSYDAKSKKLKTEISVEDSRRLLEFFSKTAGHSSWRVAIVDPADDLNIASSNALLKMIEEPPPRSLILLVCNYPGRVLRTIRSRCLKLELQPLSEQQTLAVAEHVAPERVEEAGEVLAHAAQLSGGSPGRLLELLTSEGAKAFLALQHAGSLSPQVLVDTGNRLSQRNASQEDFDLFGELLLHWISTLARQQGIAGNASTLAEAFAAIEHSIQETNALNLDRRQTVIGALSVMDKALKAGELRTL